MDILILSKRRPMGRDLYTNPYGRFYYLAYHLSEMGHRVKLVLFSYKKNENESKSIGRLDIESISVVPNPLTALLKFNRLVKRFNADWICGFSDTYFGILAAYYAWCYKSRCLIDAYDNYESYLPYAYPLHWMWRKALASADQVTCAGPALASLLGKYSKQRDPLVIPMTTDPTGFKPMKKEFCRYKLDLPNDKKIIGYCGSISHTRDIGILFQAVSILYKSNPDIILLMSGRCEKKLEFPVFARYLGYLPDEQMPYLVNSLDVLVATNRASRFGQYSHPIKIYEAMACEIPVVATETKSTGWILKNYPESLVRPGDPDALAGAIRKLLNIESIKYEALTDWRTQAEKFINVLQ